MNNDQKCRHCGDELSPYGAHRCPAVEHSDVPRGTNPVSYCASIGCWNDTGDIDVTHCDEHQKKTPSPNRCASLPPGVTHYVDKAIISHRNSMGLCGDPSCTNPVLKGGIFCGHTHCRGELRYEEPRAHSKSEAKRLTVQYKALYEAVTEENIRLRKALTILTEALRTATREVNAALEET